ncbi:MAG: zinc ribbon domain-containing protein [Ruminococcaceae bacterium]|nr:zinc ribbon domain-containing protein [Oscillospiraceae bacterium]
MKTKGGFIMICKNCGNTLPDTALFCGACGEKVANETSTENMTDVKVEKKNSKESLKTDIHTEYLVGKQKFLLKYSSKSTKILMFISWGLAFLCTALLVLSYFVTLNKPIPEISGVSYALNIDELQTEYDELIADFLDSRNDFSIYKDVNSSDNPVNDVVNSMDKVIDNPSIKNIDSFAESFDNYTFKGIIQANYVVAGDRGTEISFKWTEDMIDTISPVLSIAQVVLLCLMVLCSLFMVISSAFRINGLSIAGLIFSAIYSLLFTSLFFAIIISLFALASSTIIIITNLKYKNYKKTFYIPKSAVKGV